MAIQTQISCYPTVLPLKTLREIIDLFAEPGWIIPMKYGELSDTNSLSSKLTSDEVKNIFEFYTENPSLLIYGKGKKYLHFFKYQDGYKFSAEILHYTQGDQAEDFRSGEYDAAIAEAMKLTKAFCTFCQNTKAREHYLYRYEQDGDFRNRVLTVKEPGNGLANPAWKMWLGERYIKAFGREKLLSAPCHIVKEMGSVIFIQLFGDPEEWNSKTTLETVEQFKRHVGYDYFYDPSEPGKRLLTPDFSDL